MVKSKGTKTSKASTNKKKASSSKKPLGQKAGSIQSANKKPAKKKAPADKKAVVPLPPVEVDVRQFEQAYERVSKRAEALPQAALISVNLDLQQAALTAIKVAQRVTEPKIRQRFSNLAKTGEYESTCVDTLAEEAMAAWYVHHRTLYPEPSTQEPSRELANQGYKLRSRMLRVLEYNLDENDEVMRQLAIIRSGSGYLDLANDLTALASLYEKHAQELAKDQRRYQQGDIAEARRFASSLLIKMGGGSRPPSVGWAEMKARCWTLLDRSYREVRRGGLFLFPGEEGERGFPTLLVAMRELFPVATKGKSLPEPSPAPIPTS